MTPHGEASVVCVLGMSRTGSSLTTRVLNLMGVYLGSKEELLAPKRANPEGFWEHYGLMRLNERLLRRMGGSWREPPALPDGWETSRELDDEREQARALLDQTFTGRDLYGWKDPRNCLTLPFWQRLMPDLRYVVCLRNPVDVAASLDRRDGLSAPRSFALWRMYVAAALVHTSRRPRVFVSYESYFDDWQRPVKRLSRFLGREPAAAEAIRDSVNAGLWHHRTPPEAVLADARLPGDVRSLYVLTELLHELDHEPSPVLIDAYARALCSRREEPASRSEQRERRELERRVKELHLQLEELRTGAEP